MSGLLLVIAALAADTPVVDALGPVAREAIVRAVRTRVGAAADVTVAPLEVADVPPAIEDAILEPGAMFGRPVRVLLRSSVERGGRHVLVPAARVVVRLEVAAEHWHTSRQIDRGAYLVDGDARRVRHVVAGGAMAPLPADVIGAAVRHDLPADACLTSATILPQPAVRTGDTVTAVVRLGAVEARTAVVAVDAGRIGATVRVRHPETKRLLTATVVGRGEVEVER